MIFAVFKDDGHGSTDLSLRFFRKIKPKLGKIVSAEASQEPLRLGFSKEGHRVEYNLILIDECQNEVWLSGCNCGYGGTGPHGTFEILKEVGLLPVDIEFQDTAIPHLKHCFWIGKGIS